MSLQLHDTDGSTIAEITTDGHTLKPFINTLNQFVDEAKIHITADGLHATPVVPSNVACVDTTLPASAFEEYDAPEDDRLIGVSIGHFKDLVRRARMHHDDTLSLKVHERRMYATVTRGYNDAEVITEDHIDLVDPDSIRQEPDIPDIDLHTVDAGLDVFRDVTEHTGEISDYITYELEDGALLASAESDTKSSAARVEGVADEDVSITSLYSVSYMDDILTAIKKAKAGEIQVRFGDEMPIMVDFERVEDGETTLSGMAMLAPRIRSE